MYSTCLFCNQSLGANETFETFPIGRRIAFDAAKGRLWVVCRRCERWNLTPLDERWEVVEQAEALYADARRRVATEQIGLAKLNDGMELVRIGAPLRPEFAAWRYGDQFGRRRRRNILIAGAGIGAVGALVAGGVAAGVGVGGFGWGVMQFARFAVRGNPESIVARVNTSRGLLAVRRRHLAETSIMRGTEGPFAIHLRFKNGSADFDGAEAQRIASIVIPHANRYGGAKETIARAVGSIENAGGTEGFLDRIGHVGAVVTRARTPKRRFTRGTWSDDTGLFAMNQVDRLALEMALHEEAERRALEGELALLERAWREAEEIASIADDLTTPTPVATALARLKQG